MPISRMPRLAEVPKSSNAVFSRILILSALASCSAQNEAIKHSEAPAPASAWSDWSDWSESTPPVPTSAPAVVTPEPEPVEPCPPEMVNVNDEFCIDRYEASLIDGEKGRVLSPYYPPTRSRAVMHRNHWRNIFWKYGTSFGKRTRPPALPDWQLNGEYSYKARSTANVVPHGYLNAHEAEKACKSARKRLCTTMEWGKACKGEKKTRYPYGKSFKYDKCNYGRFPHPAQQLHGKKAKDYKLWDPRLNMIKARGEVYLHKTGDKKECASQWGKDAAYDMVGNLDEWALDGKKHVMLGGTYMRGRIKQGCDARIGAHASVYSDYSIGTRCCSGVQK